MNNLFQYGLQSICPKHVLYFSFNYFSYTLF